MWFTGCVKNTQKSSCLPPVGKVRRLPVLVISETLKKIVPLIFCLSLLPGWITHHLSCLHRHCGGLQNEQDSQFDWGGGRSLHRQQSGHPAHYVPARGPLPHTHTLLQHTLVRAHKHREKNTGDPHTRITKCVFGCVLIGGYLSLSQL